MNRTVLLRKTLRGDRNQCAKCEEYFNSTFAFDKHRTGEHEGNARRCLSVNEMQTRKMVKGTDGYWVGSVMSKEAVAAHE